MVEGFGKGAAIGGPYLFGALIDRTGDTVWSLVFVALVMVAGRWQPSSDGRRAD